jgi:hypothetical protein
MAQISEIGGTVYPNSVVPSDERSLDEKRWHKARWWRTVNRILSVVGVLLIAAVVSVFSWSSDEVLFKFFWCRKGDGGVLWCFWYYYPFSAFGTTISSVLPTFEPSSIFGCV